MSIKQLFCLVHSGVGLRRGRFIILPTDTGPQVKKEEMINTKQFRLAIDKFLTSETAGNARVQVCLPNGDFYDIKGIQLLENKLVGVRESHRLVITIEPEKWTMGKVMKKL
jgi:hypothetical protein